MTPARLTRMDPHVHGSASSCSSVTDEELLTFFRRYPEYAVVVSDHMTWRFYESPGARELLPRAIYAIEITVGNMYDFILLTADLDAFQLLLPEACSWQRTYYDPPVEVMADPRVVVIFAHPPHGGGRNGWPSWLAGLPVDFLEYNAARCRASARLSLAFDPRASAAGALVELHHHLQALQSDLFPQARFIVGSDSHNPERLGTTRLELQSAARTGAQAWERLRGGEFLGRITLAGASFTVDPIDGLLLE